LQRYRAESTGTLYALDLLGGCAGALLLSTYLIPVFGFWKTDWLCAAINLMPALLATRAGLEEKRMEWLRKLKSSRASGLQGIETLLKLMPEKPCDSENIQRPTGL
jgi:predicted membrane-bound spermidine synthase